MLNQFPAETASLLRSNYRGCGSILGRGRSLLFVICSLIGLMSVFQNSNMTNQLRHVSAQNAAAALAQPLMQPVVQPYGVPVGMLNGWANALIQSAQSTPMPLNNRLVAYQQDTRQPTVSFAAPSFQPSAMSAQPSVQAVVPAGYALQLVELPTTQPRCTCVAQQPVQIPASPPVRTYANQLQPVRPRTSVSSDNLQRLIAVHGGAVEDSRAVVTRAVGQRLVSANGLHSVRFDVLADTQRAAAYTLESGNILMTAAAVDQMRVQDKIAAVLARQLEYYLDNLGTNQSAEQLLTRAGFSPVLLAETDQYLSAWRHTVNQSTVLASHVVPY